MSVLTLSPGQIDLWLSCYDEIDDAGLLESYGQMLAPEESEQQRRFYFADDRQRYLVTRALVRVVLSRYAHIRPRDWIFSANRYGRPEIANAEAASLGLSFNISHTRGLIALGITKHRMLGIDIENTATRRVSLDIAGQFFSPVEAGALVRMPAHLQHQRFFEFWTFKEAYIKARGMGLSLPLDRFSFEFSRDHTIDLTVDPELKDEGARWELWQFRPTEQCLLAICAERSEGCTSDFRFRKVVPGVREEMVALQSTKTSLNVGRNR